MPSPADWRLTGKLITSQPHVGEEIYFSHHSRFLPVPQGRPGTKGAVRCGRVGLTRHPRPVLPPGYCGTWDTSPHLPPFHHPVCHIGGEVPPDPWLDRLQGHLGPHPGAPVTTVRPKSLVRASSQGLWLMVPVGRCEREDGAGGLAGQVVLRTTETNSEPVPVLPAANS